MNPVITMGNAEPPEFLRTNFASVFFSKYGIISPSLKDLLEVVVLNRLKVFIS